VGLVIIICIATYLYHVYKPFWQYDHIESRARKVITGSQLQAWAVQLLTRYSTNSMLKISELGTNFPQQLRGVAPRVGPLIYINYVDENDPTNNPPWVDLYWGSGLLGACGFEVGQTNFVSINPTAHAWQPGVYFYRR